MMKNQMQTGGSILGRRPRVAGSALLPALLFVLALTTVPASAQTYTVLHRFGGESDGGYPVGGLIRDTNGNLYGTTYYYGAFGYGVVFKLDEAGKETVLHVFTSADGMWPAASLIGDSNGNLYGTTVDGGTTEGGSCRHGCGTVFKVDQTGKETVLYAFTGGADGRNPAGELVRDAAGNLYGTTSTGGDLSCRTYQPGCGVVFKLDKNGKETVLHAFTDVDGDYPVTGLIRDRAGNLYGVTYDGGASDYGVVLKVDPAGKGTVLYNFAGTTDGRNPSGGLVRDAAGNLYGATTFGGDASCSPYENGCGVVFKLDKAGKETVPYTFTGAGGAYYPHGDLIRDTAGNFYGTTDGGNGAVFKVDKNGRLTVLHYLGGPGGWDPRAGVTMDKAGNLYGTTSQGGKGCGFYGCGVVFKLVP